MTNLNNQTDTLETFNKLCKQYVDNYYGNSNRKKLVDFMVANQSELMNDTPQVDKTIDIRTSTKKLLEELQMKHSYNGFEYIIDAVELLSGNRKLPLVKGVYEGVAKKYDKLRGSQVERCIRHAIQSTFAEKEIKEFLGYTYDAFPTNKEFLSLIVDKITAE